MSVEDLEIEELFDRSVREMRPEFEVRLLALARAEPSPHAGPVGDAAVELIVGRSHVAGRPSARRSLALVGAAVLVLVGAVALSLARDRRSDGVLPSSVSPSDEVVDITVPSALSSVAPTTQDPSRVEGSRLQWARADAGSIARSQVTKVIAGPTGFAAIGMGFDDGANQGRVWFSADGRLWEEPVLDVFDALVVSGVAATRDTYFVLASPNPDRGPAGDPQLFRSSDGRSWLPISADLPRNPQIGSAAGGLVMAGGESGGLVLRWSADGESWADAAIDLSKTGLIDLELPNDADARVSYLRGIGNDQEELQIFASVDGLTWLLLPSPPVGGLFDATGLGLTLIANPGEQRCLDETVAEMGVQPDPSDPTWMQRRLDAQWACAESLQLTTYDPATQAWSTPIDGPGPSPTFARLARVGAFWVAPVIGADRTTTVWTAGDDGTEWRPESETLLEFDENVGSPQPALVAARHDVVVVITPDRAVDGETVVLVGS